MTARRLVRLPVRAPLLIVFALVAGAAISVVRGHPDTVDATHHGTVQGYPSNQFIIQGHKIGFPVRMTTCTTTSSTYCHPGAYDVTINYDATKFGVVQDGNFSTGGNTSTTLVNTAAGWKKNQWVGSELRITGGPGVGQFRTVVSNTSTTITINAPWSIIPTSSSIYLVGGITDGGWIGSTGRSLACAAPEYGTGWARKQCNTLGADPDGPIGSGNLVNLSLIANNRGLSSFTITGPPTGAPIVLTEEGFQIQADILTATRRVILCPDPSGDGLISSADLSFIAQAFGKKTGQPGYTQAKDPSEDGLISSADLQFTAAVFGQRCNQQ